MSRKPRDPEGYARDLARQRRRYAADAEYRALRREQQAEHYRANRERYLAKRRRQRARERGVTGTLTAEEWERVKAFWGYRCVYCGAPETLLERLACDEADALSNGGAAELGNALPACKSCNSSKHNRPLGEWLARRDPPGPYTEAALRLGLAACARGETRFAGAGACPTDWGAADSVPPSSGAGVPPAEELGPPLSLDGVLSKEEAA